MSNDSGFAEAIGEETVTVRGGEGDSPAPRSVFERSPQKVLASLAHRPLQQAIKAIEYIDSGRERERKLLRSLTPEALDLVGRNGPEYLSSVQAAQ